MKIVVLTAVALLSAGSAHAEKLFQCDRFNSANTYQVTINTATGEAKFSGNKAGQVLAANLSVNADARDAIVEFAAEGESALRLDFNLQRLEAIVSTVDLYGNVEEIGDGVCRDVESI